MVKRFYLLVMSAAILSIAATSAMAQIPPAGLVIDDFTTGRYKTEVRNGVDEAYQSGSLNTIVGGVRHVTFGVSQPASGGYNRATILDICEKGPMFVESGLLSYWGLYLVYGHDLQGNANPLNLNLIQRGYNRFRVNFGPSDLDMGYFMQVYDRNGNVASLYGDVTTKDRSSPFYADLFFDNFYPSYPTPFDWDHVDGLLVLFYTGSAVGGNDFAVQSIVALPPSSQHKVEP